MSQPTILLDNPHDKFFKETFGTGDVGLYLLHDRFAL